MTVTVAVVNDYAVVVAGVARLLEPFTERIAVVEIDANAHPVEPVDVALYDGFSRVRADDDDVEQLLADDAIERVVMYTWNFAPELLELARRKGVAGYLSKAMTGTQLVSALEDVMRGVFVVSATPQGPARPEARGDWPGRSHGLTERESEVLALYTQGLSTRRVAEQLHLSVNSIKTYSTSLYRKLDVHTRSEAVLWGVDHGFRPDHFRSR